MKARSPSGSAATPEPESWRSFVAIELPQPVREALQRPIDELGTLGDAVRANAVDRIHLTLHFLGNVAIEKIDPIRHALGSSIHGFQRFALTAKGVGAFPGFGRPQVLWAGIQGDEVPKLMSLQRATGAVLEELGIALEDRHFHPHLTLARVRRPIRGQAAKPFRDWQSRWRDAGFGPLPVDRLMLFRSELGAGSPRYSAIASFELQ